MGKPFLKEKCVIFVYLRCIKGEGPSSKFLECKAGVFSNCLFYLPDFFICLLEVTSTFFNKVTNS